MGIYTAVAETLSKKDLSSEMTEVLNNGMDFDFPKEFLLEENDIVEYSFSPEAVFKNALKKVKLRKFDKSTSCEELCSIYLSSLSKFKEFVWTIIFCNNKNINHVNEELFAIMDIRYKYFDLESQKDLQKEYEMLVKNGKFIPMSLEIHERLSHINLYFFTKIIYDFFKHIREDVNNKNIMSFNSYGVRFEDSRNNNIEDYSDYFKRIMNYSTQSNRRNVKFICKTIPLNILKRQKTPWEWIDMVDVANMKQGCIAKSKLLVK